MYISTAGAMEAMKILLGPTISKDYLFQLAIFIRKNIPINSARKGANIASPQAVTLHYTATLQR